MFQEYLSNKVTKLSSQVAEAEQQRLLLRGLLLVAASTIMQGKDTLPENSLPGHPAQELAPDARRDVICVLVDCNVGPPIGGALDPDGLRNGDRAGGIPQSNAVGEFLRGDRDEEGLSLPCGSASASAW